MLEQFGREFMQLYPNAKLLIAGEVGDGGKVEVRVADGGEALALSNAS